MAFVAALDILNQKQTATHHTQLFHRHGPQASRCTKVLNKRFLFADGSLCQSACCLVPVTAQDSIALLAALDILTAMKSTRWLLSQHLRRLQLQSAGPWFGPYARPVVREVGDMLEAGKEASGRLRMAGGWCGDGRHINTSADVSIRIKDIRYLLYMHGVKFCIYCI